MIMENKNENKKSKLVFDMKLVRKLLKMVSLQLKLTGLVAQLLMVSFIKDTMPRKEESHLKELFHAVIQIL